ncbi:L-lactate dehydrogenase (cytochrome) [Ascoidea rubescens DSM 1968]|uniref:L-lactate dehydrogenase (cytochrome) n=1 Tax=Ascoidea rubescens DSM 1968 TaxID=1344418 RepID=A0A1D2VFC6_9ASCO|nr:cytochrome b2, mitochondrial precursor [Ascoidea rubescens DSM 1968]ODV60213.1 cytochrome b2, mitochondrial precursor [Ascoidea rubescens DSM 1968]
MPSISEVKKHDNANDCWVIVNNKIYDVTEFLPEHPGGQKIILKFAGKDCTKKFEQIHPPDTLDKYLAPEKYLGEVEQNSDEEDEGEEEEEEELDEEEKQRLELIERKPPLSQIYNLNDFEYVASKVMEKQAWAYYSSGCDDEITLRENHFAYQRIFFKPRVLRNVTNIDFSTEILGFKSSVPFYVTATALGKLGHPDGEKCLTRACFKENVIQMVPTLSSCSFQEIVDERNKEKDQTQFFQLYVNSDRKITQKIVENCEKNNIKALFITVDAPQLGRREKDMRSKYTLDASNIQNDVEEDEGIDRSQGAARAISSFIDTGLNWEDIKWFKKITKLPIILKGIQCVDDALLAIEYGVEGIVLSNHGGRQLEFARSSIEVLADLMPILKQKKLDKKIEIFIDGGVRRASDILKAIALGAKGVGIGRPFLYAMSAYGDDGVVKAMRILKDELTMNMRLLGVNTVGELNENYLDLLNLHNRFSSGDQLFQQVYEPLKLPAFKPKL